MSALDHIECLDMAPHPIHKPVMHTKFVLCKKRGFDKMVKKYKAWLVVCGNKEDEYEAGTYSPVDDYITGMLLMCTVFQER